MKKFTLILFVALVGFVFKTQAQNLVANPGLEDWTTDTAPVGWSIVENVSKEATIKHGGSFSAKHTSADATKKMRQDVSGIIAGSEYTFSYFYYDNDPMARTRIWSYWLSGTTTIGNDTAILRPSVYSEDAAQWVEFNATLTAPANADGFRFEVRVYKQDATFGGSVFYDDFSITGDVTVKPEPTNYPTAFAGGAEGMGIRLNWNDAVGGQLPDAYLIYGAIPTTGKNTEIIYPVDGTPVANNMDISLGYVAFNVTYGTETAYLGNFDADQDFSFWIFPYTNSGATIDYKTNGTVPNVNVTTNNVTTLLYEPFNADLGVMTAHSITGDQVWEHYNFSGEDFARCSGYATQSNENEDWLVSPQINLTNMQTAFLSFRTAYNYVGNPLQLYYSTDYNGSGVPTDFTWTDISAEAIWSGGAWAWAQSGDINVFNYGNPTFYIAFKYSSTVTESSTWELDDILIYGVEAVGVSEVSANNISVYPNPATAEIHFNLQENSNVRITDITGRIISENNLQSGDNNLNISHLTEGIYLIVVKTAKGNSSVTRFTKK